MEWESLLCIASNPWVIGIGGGILSGLIVAVTHSEKVTVPFSRIL